MPYVWHLAAIQLNDKTLISGTVLEGEDYTKSLPTTLFGHSRRVLRSYFQSPYKNRKIKVSADQTSTTAITNGKGYFSLLIENPSPSGLTVIDEDGNKLPIQQNYPVFFAGQHENIEVVSDVDDTIFLSHTASFFKRIATILFNLPQGRRAIPFTYQLFKTVQQHQIRVTYLSKSESNLFELIAAIIQYHQLPEGALLLTPYLKLRQLINPKKEKDYKLNHLLRLFEHMPEKQFILLGDDSQRDMPIYTEIARKYKSRILKIYIRQTGFKRNNQQQTLWENLVDTGVDVMYFTDMDEVNEEIRTLDQLIINARS